MNLDHSVLAMTAAAVRDRFPRLPMQSWLTWAHLGTTAAIAFFVWTQYQEYARENNDDVRKLAVLAAQVQAMQDIERQRHEGVDRQLVEIDRRLEAQRGDIRALQSEVNAHIDRVNGNGK